MARATGIGGVFFRSPNPQRTVSWYEKHLGIVPEDGGPFATFTWSGSETTVWSPFVADTDYFGQRDQVFMVNYRVDDLDELLGELREAGVEVDLRTERSEFGSFGWAVDCDGRRIELWQPPAGS